MAQKYNTPFPEWCCCGGGGGGGSASFFFLSETPDGITVGQGTSHTATLVSLTASEYITMQAPSVLVNGPITLLNADPDGSSGDHPLLENRNGVLYWNNQIVDTSEDKEYHAGDGISITDDTNVISVKLDDVNHYLGFNIDGRLTLTVDTDGGVVSYNAFNRAAETFNSAIDTLTREKQDKLRYYSEEGESKETKGWFSLSTGNHREYDDSTVKVEDLTDGSRQLLIRNDHRVSIQAGSLLINGPITLLNSSGTSGVYPLLENKNGVLYWNNQVVVREYLAGQGVNVANNTVSVNLGTGNQYLGFDSNGTLVALTGDSALATGPMVTAVSNYLDQAVTAFTGQVDRLDARINTKQDELKLYIEEVDSRDHKDVFTLTTHTEGVTEGYTTIQAVPDEDLDGKQVLNIENDNRVEIKTPHLVVQGIEFSALGNGPLKYETSDERLHWSDKVLAYTNELKTYTITELKKTNGTLGYLYDVTYTDYSYDDAREYSAPARVMGACSTYRKGNYVARNFDWYYDDVVEFVVKSNKPGCHRVIGIASGVGDGDNKLTKKEMEDHTDVESLYKYVPFFLVDGINDAGLVVSEHVVPHHGGDYGSNNKINKVSSSTPDTAESINAMFLPRYLLDHCSSVQDVKLYLENKIVTQSQEAFDAGFELHYLINDAAGNHMVIEFDNNRIVFVESLNLPNCLANFHVLPTKGGDASRGTAITLGPKFIDDDSSKSKRLCTPADVSGSSYKPSVENKIEMYGQGLERYNFMIKEVTGENSALYDGPNTEFEVMDKMSGIWFSNAYQSGSTLNTEFTGDSTSVGYTHLTVDSPASDYDASGSIKTAAINLWGTRSRDDDPKRYWQTTHCVVYNIENRSLLVKVQESAKESEWDNQFKLAIYRGLDKSQETYVVPRFHDDGDSAYDSSRIKCEHGARYELKSSGNSPRTYSFNTYSSLVVGPSETIELHFDVNSAATYPGPIYQIVFPIEWLWINETDGTVDSTRFSNGNTYDITVRNDGRKVIANVAYEYTTVVSGPTA